MTYTSRKNNAKKSVYSIVTERIVKQMEQGIIPWRKPWDNARPSNSILAMNAITGDTYSFINQALLGMRGGLYVGYKQMEKYGGKLKPNSPKYFLTCWFKNTYLRTDKQGNAILDEDGNEQSFTKYSLGYHWVYDIEDIEGLRLPKKRCETRHNTGIDEADNVIGLYMKNNGITFDNTGSNKAFYRPSTDSITVPNINQFKEVSEYYSTTFHEMTHSTGHEKRLDRLTKSGFGTSDYAKEELVAELGSAFTMAILGIENKATETNTAAYLQGWIKACKEDETLIVSASTMAEKAVNYIFETAKAEDPTEEEVIEQVENETEELESKEEESGFVEFKVENASFKLNPVGVMRSMALKDFNKMLKYIKAYEKTRNQNLNLLINAGQNLKRTTFKKKEVETLDKKMKYIMA